MEEELRAAYNRARRLSGSRLRTWWDRFLVIRDYYKEHDGYDGISIALPTWSDFATLARSAYKKGNLSTEQIMALKEINFPFQTMKKTTQVRKKPKLNVALRLKEISQTVIPLTEEEQDELDKNIKFYQVRFNQGQCADKTAERLGLKMDI